MTATWIFQGNPDAFDVDGYLQASPASLTWTVRQHRGEISAGDRVFLWRAGGKGRSPAGVVAEAEVIERAVERPEEEAALRFWHDPVGRSAVEHRALLRLVRIAGTREILRRDWLLEDPVLKHMAVVRQPAGTNFPVRPEEARRLDALWTKTGQNWSRAESVAGLWAYAQTYRGEVSRLDGSPVAKVALAIGRAISGVYNKTMNFRAIDPRDSRTGMTGASEVDRHVWAEFFDAGTGTLRGAALAFEFARLWGTFEGEIATADAKARSAIVEREAARLSSSSLAELIQRYEAEIGTRPAVPKVRSASAAVFERSPLVVAIAKLRGGSRCEVPSCEHPVFHDADGRPYCEVHHVQPLADGGPDIIGNVACLCPAHHREVHHGRRSPELTRMLRAVRASDSS